MLSENIDEQIEFFSSVVPAEITTTRWEHSLRVAEIAKELAELYSPQEIPEAYLAGVVHDITKQKSKDFHLSIFRDVKDMESQALPEAAWHSHSAPHYLKNKYGLKTESILGAVRNHTLGGNDLTILECILYASDFLGSDFAERQPNYDLWRKQTRENLFWGVLNKATHTLSDLLENKKEIHARTIAMYHFALGKLSN